MLACSITPKPQGSSVDPFHTIDDTDADETIVFLKGLMKCISHLVDFLDISLEWIVKVCHGTVWWLYGGYLELNRMIGPRWCMLVVILFQHQRS